MKQAYLMKLRWAEFVLASRVQTPESVSYLMHDIHTNSAPSKIVNLFSQTSSIHEYNTRSSSKNNMYIKKFNLEKLRQAVPIFGTKVWNEIPGRMRDMSKKCSNEN